MHIDFINPVNISSHTRIHKKNIIDHHRKFQRKKTLHRIKITDNQFVSLRKLTYDM